MKSAKSFIVVIALSMLCSGSVFAQGDSDRWLRIEVRDARGQALPRACVTVVPREGEIVFRKADSNGKVKVKGLQPGSYRVVVKVDGYEAQKREVTFDANTETVAFSLQPRKL
jgi:hypothetical protein